MEIVLFLSPNGVATSGNSNLMWILQMFQYITMNAAVKYIVLPKQP